MEDKANFLGKGVYNAEDVISADAKNVLSGTVIATQHRSQFELVSVDNVRYKDLEFI